VSLSVPVAPLRSAAVILALGVVLVLAGCARYTAGTNLTCPRAVFLGGTEVLTRFAPGAARTDANAVAAIELDNLQYSCQVSRRDAQALVSFEVRGVRRDTSAVADIDVPYFIAVTDVNGAVVAKHNFTARLHYLAGVNAVTSFEQIQETIPLGPGQRAVGYELVIGIQLSREELDYNLARR
jgi:hypothetical protein